MGALLGGMGGAIAPWSSIVSITLIALLSAAALGACGGPVERAGVAAVVERIPNGNTLEVRPLAAIGEPARPQNRGQNRLAVPAIAPPPPANGSASSPDNSSGNSPGNSQKLERVRLLGIDAPDLRQNPWGVQAQQALADLVAGQQVWLEFDEAPRDRFGRLLAYVWRGDQLINEQLLVDGQALLGDRVVGLRYAERLRNAQSRARLLEAGLWNPAKPLRLAPAAFRAQNP